MHPPPSSTGSDSWNCLDGTLVSLSIFEMVMMLVVGEGGNLALSSTLRMLRMLRIVRAVRLLRKWKAMYAIVLAFAKAIPQVGNLIMLMSVIMFIFAILGITTFGHTGVKEIHREHFDNFPAAMITVLNIFIGGYVAAYQACAEAVGPAITASYFAPVMIVGNITLLNLFVAILLETFASDDDEEDEEEAEAEPEPPPTPPPGIATAVGAGIATRAAAFQATANLNTAAPTRLDRQGSLAIARSLEQMGGSGGGGGGKKGVVVVGTPLPPAPAEEEEEEEEPTAEELMSTTRLYGTSCWCYKPDNKLRLAGLRLITNESFEFFILILIMLSSACLIIDSPRLDPDSGLHHWLGIINLWFTAIFTLECLLRVFVRGFRGYMANPWNKLDFLIVSTSLLSLLAILVPALGFLKQLRILRVARPLRLLMRDPGMRIVVETLIKTLPAVFNILSICFALMVVFGIIGMRLFSGTFGSCSTPEITDRDLCNPAGAASLGLLDLGGGHGSSGGGHGSSGGGHGSSGGAHGSSAGDAHGSSAGSAASTTYEPPVAAALAAPPPVVAVEESAAPIDDDDELLLEEAGEEADDDEEEEDVGMAMGEGEEGAVRRRRLQARHRSGRQLKGAGGGGGGKAAGVVVWENPPSGNFDNFGSSMLALFVMTTGDNMPDIMFAGMDSIGVDIPPERHDISMGVVYFIAWILVGSFMALNLFVGVIVDNFSKLRAEASGSALLTEEQKLWVAMMKESKSSTAMRVPKPPSTSGPLMRCLLPYRLPVYHFVRSKGFDASIMLVIICNVLVLACDYHGIENEPEQINMLHSITHFLSLAYYAEFALKIWGFGPNGYFNNDWCRFEFALLMCAIPEKMASHGMVSVPPMIFRVVRLTKILRMVRLLQGAKDLRELLQTLAVSVPALVNVCSLLLLMMFIYAVLGVTLFTYVKLGDAVNPNANFITFGGAMLLLFQALTGDSWSAIMRDLMVGPDDGCNPDMVPTDCGTGMALPYFLSYMLISNFVCLNLIVAVVIENFSNLKNARLEKEKNPDGIVSSDNIEDYRERWAELDPEADGFVRRDDFPKLIAQLLPPLGLKRVEGETELERYRRACELCLELKTMREYAPGPKGYYKQGTVAFQESLDCLVSRAFALQNAKHNSVHGGDKMAGAEGEAQIAAMAALDFVSAPASTDPSILTPRTETFRQSMLRLSKCSEIPPYREYSDEEIAAFEAAQPLLGDGAVSSSSMGREDVDSKLLQA